MEGNILIIDDEETLRKLLARIIGLEGFNVSEAGTISAASEILKRKQIDIILCDVKLPDGNGVDFVKTAKQQFPLTEIILLTAYGNIPDGVQAIKNGAFDYITKGNDNDRILPLLYQAIEKVTLQKDNAVTINTIPSGNFEEIIGTSVQIQQMIALSKKIAPSNAAVLLLGETGTGKEVFAKAIHNASTRSTQAFVAINCSAFSRDLLEGELFGYKAGAYTGAVKDKKGLIEIADKGTLFLDEIGEMNLELQAKMLRVLESGEFIKLGDTRISKVSVRIIAATNRNLSQDVNHGLFREDLFYRLNTFTLQLPPLRERKEDIKTLANTFLKIFATRENKPKLKIDNEAISYMERYQWKGNIRELKNTIERAVILADDDFISINDLPSEIRFAESPISGNSLAEIEKNHIIRILQYSGNNKTRTAQLLGIGLATLYRKMDEYNIPK
jgi:two-component system NtrC family response regulator